MIARSLARFAKVSPRKARQVIDLIRGETVESAFDALSASGKGCAKLISQTLNSALDSSIKKTEGKTDAKVLYISKITATDGPMLNRFKAVPMGRAVAIRRRTSHILIELDTIPGFDMSKAKKPKKAQGKKQGAKKAK